MLPVAATLPDQPSPLPPPDAVQDTALVVVHFRIMASAVVTLAALAVRLTVGGTPGDEIGVGAATTIDRTACGDPPHWRSNVAVPMSVGVTVTLPEAARFPDQPTSAGLL